MLIGMFLHDELRITVCFSGIAKISNAQIRMTLVYVQIIMT